MSAILADPAEMIAHGAPHVIHNDAELEAYTDALFQLTALENPSRNQEEAIELLTLLVERYEQEHYAVPAADPASVVRFLIEQQNLTQRDLIPQFGSESAVSMFLAGHRNLTIEQVRKLSTRFKLPADVFIPKAVAAKAYDSEIAQAGTFEAARPSSARVGIHQQTVQLGARPTLDEARSRVPVGGNSVILCSRRFSARRATPSQWVA